MSQYIVEVKNLTKRFGGVLALDKVSVGLEKGMVHALLGKNGSGKSTLVNLISGVYRPTGGQVILKSEEIQFHSPREAQNRKIALVHQEMSLILELSIAENIFLGRYPKKKNGRIIDWKKCIDDAGTLLKRLSIDLDPQTKVGTLSVGQRQMLEICKAMALEPSLLILDEPTSALTKQEVDELFRLVRQLKEQGETIIYITHRLDELEKIVDTVTVLRDGRFVGKRDLSDLSNSDIINMMFGETVMSGYEKGYRLNSDEERKTVLQVSNLTQEHNFNRVSFALKEGEILGIAGMLGSGRTEILRAIYGLDCYDSGEILMEGRRIKSHNPKSMKKLGFAFLSEDRKGEGLVHELSIHRNLCIAPLGVVLKQKYISDKREKPLVNSAIDQLKIKTDNPQFPVSTLSGGNQQKVVVGNWLNCRPKVLLFDEPSRGIDVQAKRQIFNIMKQQAKIGTSSIMVSTELEELLEVCDRILVLRKGCIVKEIYPDQVNTNQLYLYCMGEKV